MNAPIYRNQGVFFTTRSATKERGTFLGLKAREVPFKRSFWLLVAILVGAFSVLAGTLV